MALPTKQEDVDALWAQARSELRVPAVIQKEKRSPETKRNDGKPIQACRGPGRGRVADERTEDRTFRTNVVLLFLGSNMLIILLFTSGAFTEWLRSNWSSASASTFNPYLTAIFYSVLFLSAVRFIGCVLYLIFRLCGH